MPNANLRAEVPPIAVEPSPHGILSGCIEVITTNDPHELNGTQLHANGCTKAHGWQDCPQPGGRWTNPATKTFERTEFCSFEPITAQAGVECSTFGISQSEAERAAFDALNLTEQNVLEDFFLRQFLTDGSHTTDLSLPGPSTLHIANGIGMLEQWLSTEFGGRGVIHVPVGVASLLSKNRLTDFPNEPGDCIETLAGNLVVLGGGYGANLGPAVPPALPVPAAAGEVWIYITPAMRIRRDRPFIVPPEERNSVNILTNDRRVNAETTFVPEVACCRAAAVRVSLSACC